MDKVKSIIVILIQLLDTLRSAPSFHYKVTLHHTPHNETAFSDLGYSGPDIWIQQAAFALNGDYNIFRVVHIGKICNAHLDMAGLIESSSSPRTYTYILLPRMLDSEILKSRWKTISMYIVIPSKKKLAKFHTLRRIYVTAGAYKFTAARVNKSHDVFKFKLPVIAMANVVKLIIETPQYFMIQHPVSAHIIYKISATFTFCQTVNFVVPGKVPPRKSFAIDHVFKSMNIRRIYATKIRPFSQDLCQESTGNNSKPIWEMVPSNRIPGNRWKMFLNLCVNSCSTRSTTADKFLIVPIPIIMISETLRFNDILYIVIRKVNNWKVDSVCTAKIWTQAEIFPMLLDDGCNIMISRFDKHYIVTARLGHEEYISSMSLFYPNAIIGAKYLD